MKKILLVACFFATLVVFASCKKDNEGINPDNMKQTYIGEYDTAAECESACSDKGYNGYSWSNGSCSCLSL